MITTNTNGQAISQTFIDALTDDNRVYDAKLLVNGTELECSIDSIDITKGSCGSTYAFSVGSVVGSTLRAQVQELADDVKGQEVEVQIGLQVAEDTFEYITVGYFVVSEAPKDVYTTTIIGYGLSITATGKSFTPPATQTLANIATSIASSISAIAGRTVTVTFGTGITTSAVISESMKGLSVYQALQTLASVCGGFAIDTADGNIKICRFSDTATLARDAESLKSVPVIAEEDFAVDGVLCVVQEETAVTPAVQFPEEPSGMENLVIYNRYVTEALYDAFLDTLDGYTYRPAKLTLAYGDPRLEGDDVLQITDVDDSVYIVPCHMITHHYAGGLVTIVESVDATEQENEVSSSATGLTKTISQVVVKAEGAREVAEEAKTIAGNTDQYFWHTETGTDTGAHITEIPKEDFLADPDNGGGNLLARSNGIAVRDGLTELATFGGTGIQIGQTENGSSRAVITADGMRLITRSTTGNDYEVVDLGYGTTIGGDSGETPFYTLGIRKSGSDKGSRSVAEGYHTEASEVASHAEGYRSVASGKYSHAEGGGALTGNESVASGTASHAEGRSTEASGDYSHAQNYHTTAGHDYQTAVGKWNDNQSNSLFEVGDGTSSAPRNAFVVDTSGNAKARSALFANGAEFSKQTGNHVVVGGIHVCWGDVSISCTANTYTQTTVTLPYTYTNAPHVFTSFASQNSNARTTYGTNGGGLPLNEIHVGAFSITTRNQTVCWMTIGV